MSQHTTRRRVIALATACVLSLGLAACGKSSTPDASASSDTSAVTGKTVRVWFMEGSISDDAIEYLEKTFAEQNPGITSFTHFRCMRALAELSTVRIFSKRPISLSRRASMSWQTQQSSWARPTQITLKDSPACTCRQWISTVSNP